MSQSSRGYSADDLEEEPSLTPSGAEERGSDSLRSPAFQEAAVEPGPPPMPEPVQRDFGTPMAGALGNFEAGPAQEAPAAPDIAHPARELSGNSSPEIGQAIQNLGQGPEPLAMPRAGSGFEDAWIHETERRQRESERQQSGIHAYLASKGVQTQILPDGTHAIATDETGAPLWKAAVSAPYQDPETGRWLVKSRDQRGVLQDVDLLSTKGIVHTDQKTAARYIIGQNKQSIDLNSPDPAVISRNQTAAVRSDLYAREQLANQQVAKIQAGMADAQATVRTMDAMNGAPPVLGSRPKSVAALKNFIKTNTQGMKAGILTEDQQAEYKDAQANLERHYQDFPEHRLAEDAVTGAKAQIAQIKQAYLEDRDRRLALRLNPHSTAATAALLPTVQGNAAPGTVEAAQVDQDTAQAAAQGRTTLSLAMPGVLQRMKASGVQFVGKGDQQRPIDEAIRDALNPDALNPPKRQPLAPAPAPKAPGPSATKNFFGTLINSFGTLINSFAITGDEIGEAVGRSLSYMSGGTMGGDLIKGALMGPAAGDAINPGLRTLGEGITHDTQEDIRYRDELQTGKYTPGNPYAPTAPGNTLGEAMVNPKRTGDFATGVAKAVPEVGLLALNPMAAIGTMTGVGAMKGGDKAVSDAITHGDANPEDARMGAMAKSGGTSALIAAFYALTGGVVGKVMPAVANPLARALTAAGITAPVLAAVDAGATKLAGGNAIPQTPDEWGERLAMLVFFTGHAGFGEYGRPKQVEQVLNAAQTAPERIQLAKAQIAALNGARPLVEGQGDEVTLAKLNAYQAAAQKFLDAQNPKLVEKIRVRMQQAAEAAKAASQTDAGTPPPGQSAPLGEVPPPSEDDEGGSGISSGKEPAPHSPAGQAKAFSETLKAKDELAPKIKAAQDAGTVSAPLLAENDVHGADAHQVEQRATSEIPEGIRNRIAAVLGADGPANEAHFAQDPDHGFAAAHVGKELRDTYTTPEQQAALERIGQGLGDKAPVAEYVADQHVGMLAGRDLLAIATGRGEVAPERLAELGRLGLVEPGADGTPHVTHDALPLLPNNLTAKLVTAHDRFRVLSLHGEKLEGAAAMVRNGQGQLETALHARATAAREQASAKPYHVRVEFTDHKGEAQERVIRGKFHNDEQALAHALTVAEKRGMKVTDAKVSTPEKEAARKRQSSSAPVPAGESSSEHTDPLEARKNVFTKVDAKTFEPEQRGAIRTVMQFLRQNRAELKAIGIDPEPEFGRNSRDSSGLAVTSGGKLLLDGKQLREHFDALGSREKALEWVKAAVIEEEGLHRHQFLATEKAGLDFKEHYDAIRKEAPADMVQHARETYEGFEQLAPHEQGAELERMVLQQKWHGSLTERMFKSIERILAYLKGLKIQSPLLKESIARVEAVRDEALKRANEARDEVPKARDTGASPPPESPSGAPAAREGSRVPLFASKAKPEEPLIRESRLNGLHNLAATGADDVGAKARFYGSTPEEVAYVESLVAQTHGKADNMFFTAARTKKARAAAQKVRDSLGQAAPDESLSAARAKTPAQKEAERLAKLRETRAGFAAETGGGEALAERIEQTAYRDRNGKIYKTGPIHDGTKLPKRFQDEPGNRYGDIFGVEPGFVTTTGRFLNRTEAHELATKTRQVKASYDGPPVLWHENFVPRPESSAPVAAPEPHVLTKPEGRSVINAYHHLAQKTGFPAVSIAELSDQSGIPLDRLKQQLLRSQKAGSVVLSTGDWSLSSDKVRSGAIEQPGQRPMLQVRFLNDAGGMAAARAPREKPRVPLADIPGWNEHQAAHEDLRSAAEVEKETAPEESHPSIDAATKEKRDALTATYHAANPEAAAIIQTRKEASKLIGRAIPPGWRDVKINPDLDARILVTGKDAKDREQSFRSDADAEAGFAEKHERVTRVNQALPAILRRVRESVGGPKGEESAVVRLIHLSAFRNGGDSETGAETKAYGASNLRAEHVRIQGNTVHFDFPGKDGVRQQHSITDAKLAADMVVRKEHGGALFATNDAKVRAYLKQIAGPDGSDFKVHDLRTWNATALAGREVVKRGAPKSEAEFNKARNEIGDIVAKKLGDTRSVVLKSYIDPTVFEPWKDTLPSDESRPQRPESSAVHWSMESRGQHAEKPSGRGIGDEGFSGDSALLEHASAAEDGSAGRLEQGALFASKATADPVAPRKEAAPDDTGALQSSKALTALHDKIAEKLIPAKQELRAAGSKREIAQDYDAAETGANIGGDQAGNMIRLDFARPKPANESPGQRKAREAAQTADREAMPYVIENGIKPLAQQRADVLASSDPKLIKSELPKVDRAIANFTRLDKLRFNHDRLMGLSMRQLKGAGVSVGEVQDYITRKLELPDATKDAEPSPMFPMGNGAAGSPRYFTKGRSFATLSEAVRAGYKPVSTDIAKLDQHRIEAGRKMIEQRQFFEKLKKTPSPTDGKPIIGEMIQRPLANGETEATVPHGYTTVTMAGRPFVVHKQFADLFSNLFGQSAIRSTIAGRALLKLAAAGKHGTLVFDTFHVGRLLYKMASGIGNLSTAVGEGSPIKMRDGKPSFGYHAGRTLLEYSDSDLGRAQAAGDITAKEAAFARKYRAQFDELVKSGLNIGKVSDNLMEQAGLHIPGVSTANKWIFGKLSRGAMAQTALKFYDRNLSRSGMSREQAARRTATEMNEYFGNLQNQGIFKSKTLQDVARLVFLAPNWTESQFRYEARAYGQIGASVVDLARGKGLRAGNATRAMAAGFVGLLAANQVANYLSRGQSTFQNEEDGHKLDAWVPGGKRGFWFNPFEIAGEYAHAAMKYAAQHENPVDIATHIASNKLSPLGRGVKEAATGRDYSGRHFLNDTDRFRGAAVDALPSPMPLGGFFEKDPRSPTGYRITRAPGAFQKQLMQSAGAKVTAAQSPRTQMFAIAHDFRPDGQYVDSAGEYTELRRALDNDQPDAAQSEVQWLLGRGKTLKQIGEALGIKAGGISKEQFTGGAEREQSMLATLTPEQRKVYDQAQRDHVENAKKFRALVTTPEFQQSVAGAKTPAVDKSATSEFDQLPLPQAIDRFKKSMNDPAISPETRRQWRAILQRKHAQVGQLKAA